jgi:hypothetical protein
MRYGPDEQPNPKWLDCGSAIFAAFLVILSAGMFLLQKHSKEVSELLNNQNNAGMRLEENLRYYQWIHDTDAKDDKTKLFPPGLFEDLISFSRNNAKIIYAIDRLSFHWKLWGDQPDRNCPPEPQWCSCQRAPKFPRKWALKIP